MWYLFLEVHMQSLQGSFFQFQSNAFQFSYVFRSCCGLFVCLTATIELYFKLTNKSTNNFIEKSIFFVCASDCVYKKRQTARHTKLYIRFYSFTWFDLKKVKNHLFYLILFLIISIYTSSISIIIPVLFAFCFSFIIFIASAVVPLPPKGSIISASFGKIPIILHITSNGI